MQMVVFVFKLFSRKHSRNANSASKPSISVANNVCVYVARDQQQQILILHTVTRQRSHEQSCKVIGVLKYKYMGGILIVHPDAPACRIRSGTCKVIEFVPA